MLVINLDTNHVSDLVRRPHDSDVRDVLSLLERDDARLGLSHLHTAQLAAPSFREWPALRDILSNVPHVLLQPRENIFDEEAACAVARTLGLSRRPPRVFAHDTSEWGYRTGPQGYGAIDMIEFFRERESHRQELLSVEAHFVAGSQLKREAYVIRTPLGPVTLMLRDHLADFRRTTLGYGGGLGPEEIVARVGGLRAFPAYEVAHVLTTYVLLHDAVRAKVGDLADEYIASFAPYVAVSALDGPTAHRIREAKLACSPRVTKRLRDIPALLERVRQGEVSPVPAA